MTSSYPSDEQLIDVFNSASSALIRLDEHGTVVSNPAASTLFGSRVKIEQVAAALSASARPERELVNKVIDTENSAFPVAIVNVAAQAAGGGIRYFFAARPRLGSALPASSVERPDDTPAPTAQTWMDAVEAAAADEAPVTDTQLLREVFDHAPVAIHVIATDGIVVAANQRDIDLVGATEDVDGYVGGHIRRAYADQDVVDDFLSRWDTDGPIIDFRAHFLNTATATGQKMPVVIYSTARASGAKLVNTRCFVFTDENPAWRRDEALENLGS
ncbi:PAS domain-containing protein [Pseudonocardia spinosispora]|uniref:PAS domain-containing protein n=1 Tax=Pseudonocardia spinosispora TaxID=103441 RepID=UPI0004265DE5|nr:PAS domain-containing protein [Pseudonocardia spinosispora]